jgi:hypothetical protein
MRLPDPRGCMSRVLPEGDLPVLAHLPTEYVTATYREGETMTEPMSDQDGSAGDDRDEVMKTALATGHLRRGWCVGACVGADGATQDERSGVRG